MLISQIFKLNKQQPELDFVDVNVDNDIRLFIDPYYLANRTDPWCLEVSETIRNYFQNLIDKLRAKDKEAIQLLSYLHEPNETCLGLSQGKPSGRGVGSHDMANIYESLSKSKAVQTGIISDIEDCHIFVEGFGKDKLSDMTTGIIRRHLIKYTQQQAMLNGFDLRQGTPSGFFWDPELSRWNNEYTEMLVIDNRKILLVPKGIVSFSTGYTPDKYYNKFVLDYLRNDLSSLKPILIQQRKNGQPYVTKKSLRIEYPYSKEFLHDFTQRNPKIFNDFRRKAKNDYRQTENYELHPCDIPQLTEYLIEQLCAIAVGPENATQYHRLIAGILELIFYPDLMFPYIEQEIDQGRKRIDIVFNNASKEKFFYDLHSIKKIHCPYIFIECKNYSSDPKNPEIDQLIGRFSTTRGIFGLLLCRQIKDLDLFIERCKDTLKNGHGLIIPLIDSDIMSILDDIGKTAKVGIVQSQHIYNLLEERCRRIYMG